jgi:hypothetical protein
VPVKIPTDATNQKIKITVGGGSDIEPPQAVPESLDDLLANIQRLYPVNALIVTLETPGKSLSVRGQLLEDLPASAAAALAPHLGDDTTQHYRTRKTYIIPQDTVASGKHSIQIETGRRTR